MERRSGFEPGPSRERESHAELMERLDRKVDAVLALKQEVDAIDVERSSEVIDERLAAVQRSIEAQFDSEVVAKAHHALEAAEEMRQFGSDAKPEQLWSFNEYVLGALDDDAEYVFNIGNVIRRLSEKHRDLTHVDSEDSLTRLEILQVLLKDFSLVGEVIRSVRRTPFELTFYVDDEVLKKKSGFERANGMHFINTPYSIVRDNLQNSSFSRNERHLTTNHESLHNLLDGAHSISAVSERVSATRGLLSQKSPEAVRDKPEMKEILNDFKPDVFLDELHGEFISALEQFEDNNLPLTIETYDDDARFKEYEPITSTAGAEIRWMYDFLRLIGQSADVTVADKEKAAVGADTLKHSFVEAMDHLRRAMFYAEEIDANTPRVSVEPTRVARDVVHALALALRPSKYRHLVRYLEHRFEPALYSKASNAVARAREKAG